MRSRARRSAGVGEIAPTAWISAFHEFRLWLFESFDPGPSLSSVLVDSRNNLTFGRRVSASTLIPLSQAVGSGGRVPSSLRLFRPSNPSVRPPGSTEVDRTSADSSKSVHTSWGPQRSRAARFSTAPSITTPASTYRHSATSSLRASATTIFFFWILLAPLVRSRYQRVSAELGWWFGHNQANWIIVWRKR